MIAFTADYFDGVTSKASRVRVVVKGEYLVLTLSDGVTLSFALKECALEPPLGSGATIIRLPGAGHLETQESAQAAELSKLMKADRFGRLLHFVETSWHGALAALAATTVLILLLVHYGIPFLADKAAFGMPPTATDNLSDAALAQLDRHLFKPSELPEKKQREIADLFRSFSERAGIPPPELIFRKLDGPPNAFALPGGKIVFTDGMAGFVKSDDELLGVLAHEAAHLSERHALRQILRNTGVYVLITLTLGDAAGIVSAAATLPTLLVENAYSREFEREADELGAALMQKAGRDPLAMLSFLSRMAEAHPGEQGSALLSTHPGFDERIQNLKAAVAKLPPPP